jgi:DUF309 family protein family protein
VTLPLPLRDRLADLVLEAFHDHDARRGLEALAAVCANPRALDGVAPPAAFPAELFDRGPEGWRIKWGYREHAAPLTERATRAALALADRPLAPADPPLETVLDQAAVLFAARLYFEVHEILEPHWMRAEGATRRALQGLIQVAVGYQHLANANLGGARALLHDGAAKLLGPRLVGRDLDAFARAVAVHARELAAGDDETARRFDWRRVPPFPAEA